MRLAADRIVTYSRPCGRLDRCRVQVYREPDQRPVAIASQCDPWKAIAWPHLIRAARRELFLTPDGTLWVDWLPPLRDCAGGLVIQESHWRVWLKTDERGDPCAHFLRVPAAEIEELIGRRLQGVPHR